LWIGNHLSKTHGGTAASEDLILRLRQRGWRINSSSNKVSQILRLADMMSAVLKKRAEYSVGIIDVFSGNAFLYAEILTEMMARLGKRIILVLHGGALVEFEAKHPHRVRRLLAKAHQVCSPSQYLAQGLGFLRREIVHVPNGLDIQQYEFKKRNQARPSLCWLRAFCSIYNPAMAVECLSLLRPEFPAVHLHMIGPDRRDGALEIARARAGTLRVQDAVTFLGPVPRALVNSKLQQGDIFLNTTNYDSFGVSTLEAAASGLCVITTAAGEHRFLWKDGRDALLVPVNDSKAMAAATRSILLNPDLASTLSCNGRRNAERFNWSNVMPKWESLLAAAKGCPEQCSSSSRQK
jgi:glycosyltransferase involved in cell wall biosynthesis